MLYSDESGGVWESLGLARYLRPVKIWSLKLDLLLWGANPIGFHLTAILVFACNVVATFLILELLLPGRRAFAALGAWLVALHPIFSEIVPVASFREETLASLFTLLSLNAFLRHRIRGCSPLGFWLFYVLGLLTKESAVVGVALALGYDAVQAWLARERGAALGRRLRLYVPFLVILPAYAALRALAFGTLTGPGTSFASPSALLAFHRAFFRDFLFHPELFPFGSAPGVPWLAAAVVGLGVWIAIRHRAELGAETLGRLAFLGPIWYAGSTSILHGVYFAHRHHVLPTVGILLFLAALLEACLRALRPRREPRLVAGVMACAALAFVPLDLRRSREHDAAARDVERARATIEAQTRDVPDGGAVWVRNAPQLRHSPWYFGWGLQSALRRPFTESDLAGRVVVYNRRNVELNHYDLPRPERFDRVVTLKGRWPPR